MASHHDLVTAFFATVKANDPQRYAEVEERYRDHPVLNAKQWRRVHQKEQPVGLLGLQPCAVSAEIGERYGFGRE